MTQPTWGYPGARRPAAGAARPGSWPPAQGWPPPASWGPAATGWPAAARSGAGRQAAPWGRPTPPRRRRNPFAGALRVIVVVALVLFGASLVKGMIAGDASSTEQAPPSVPGGPVGGYRNEGYTPPPADLDPPGVPGPRSASAAETLVVSNPVYDESVPTPTNCAMERLDMARADADQMEQHFDTLMGCLMTVYEEPVTAAGFELPRPPVTVYTRPIRTACGDFDEVNAAYCAADQRVYYAAPLLDAFPPQVSGVTYAAEMILAHEFGHAVQARTAILISGKVLEDRQASEAAANEMSRRLEVQADCLAGLYVRSVAQSQELGDAQLRGLSTLARNLGDDVLSGRSGYSAGHGTGQARETWFAQGLGSDAIGTCNTFAAPSDAVR